MHGSASDYDGFLAPSKVVYSLVEIISGALSYLSQSYKSNSTNEGRNFDGVKLKALRWHCGFPFEESEKSRSKREEKDPMKTFESKPVTSVPSEPLAKEISNNSKSEPCMKQDPEILKLTCFASTTGRYYELGKPCIKSSSFRDSSVINFQQVDVISEKQLQLPDSKCENLEGNPSEETIQEFEEFVRKNDERKLIFQQNMQTIFKLNESVSLKLMSPSPTNPSAELRNTCRSLKDSQEPFSIISRPSIRRHMSKYSEQIAVEGIRGGESRVLCCLDCPSLNECYCNKGTAKPASCLIDSCISIPDPVMAPEYNNPRLEQCIKEFMSFQDSWNKDNRDVFSFDPLSSPCLTSCRFGSDDDIPVISCSAIMEEQQSTSDYQRPLPPRITTKFQNDHHLTGITNQVFRKLALLNDCFHFVYYQIDGVEVKLFRYEEVSKRICGDLQQEKENLRNKKSLLDDWVEVKERMHSNIVKLRHNICIMRAKKGQMLKEKIKVDKDNLTLEKKILTTCAPLIDITEVTNEICMKEKKWKDLKIKKLNLDKALVHESIQNQNKKRFLLEMECAVNRLTLQVAANNPAYQVLQNELVNICPEIAKIKEALKKYSEIRESKVRLNCKLVQTVKRMESNITHRKGSIINYNNLVVQNVEELEEVLSILQRKSEPLFQMMNEIEVLTKMCLSASTKLTHCIETYKTQISVVNRAKLKFCSAASTSQHIQKYFKITGGLKETTTDNLTQEFEFLQSRRKELQGKVDERDTPKTVMKTCMKISLEQQRQDLLKCVKQLKEYNDTR